MEKIRMVGIKGFQTHPQSKKQTTYKGSNRMAWDISRGIESYLQNS